MASTDNGSHQHSPDDEGPEPPPSAGDNGRHLLGARVPLVHLGQESRVLMGILAVGVGLIAGIGAGIFRWLVALIHNLAFAGNLSLVYDSEAHTEPSAWGAGIIVVPVLGVLVVTYLVKRFAPEAKGHGVPEVDDAIYYGRGIIRPVVAAVKSLASSISIGTGASVGREGPIIQIGAAFGSTLGQIVRMEEWQRITLIACGVAGGIAATFNTPLGGLLFAIELTLPETSARTLIPVGLATGAATFLGRLFFGVQPAFEIPEMTHPALHLMGLESLVVYILFGILVGLVALAFIRTLYACEDLIEALPVNDYVAHGAGMLVVGVMMFLFMAQFDHYYVQGVGYATIQDILTGRLDTPFLLLLLLAAKLLATSLTLGSGASGGVFSPSLFLGATLGAACGVLLNRYAPGLDLNASNMAVVGMASMVGSATGAVVTAVVMIFEMTRNYNVIIPLIVTGSIAYGVRHMFLRDSIYTFKLTRRGHYIPDSMTTNMFMLRRALDLVEAPAVRMDRGNTVGDLSAQVRSDQTPPHVLLEEAGYVVAVLTAERHLALDEEGHAHTWLEEHVDSDFVVAGKDDMIFDIVAQLRSQGADIAVITRDGRLRSADDVVGVLSLEDIARSSNLTHHILASE